jgi:hypothetical protein
MRRAPSLCCFLVATLTSAAALAQSPEAAPPTAASPAPPAGPRPVELFLVLGPGSALCDNKKPDSDCPVEGAGAALGLGGGWRFHRRFSVNLELSAWTFKVRDAWKGKLDNPATDVKFGSTYISLIARYYFYAGEIADAYLGFGVGVGSVNATAENAGGKYQFEAKGTVFPASLGVEWRLAPWFRLGPQGLIYVHKTNERCETVNGGASDCRSPDGGENNAIVWRLAAVGTFLFGGP